MGMKNSFAQSGKEFLTAQLDRTAAFEGEPVAILYQKEEHSLSMGGRFTS